MRGGVGEGGINFNVLCFVFTCYICLISENINTCSCCGKKFQISNLINLDAAQPNHKPTQLKVGVTFFFAVEITTPPTFHQLLGNLERQNLA